jgi:hypothetical protein
MTHLGDTATLLQEVMELPRVVLHPIVPAISTAEPHLQQARALRAFFCQKARVVRCSAWREPPGASPGTSRHLYTVMVQPWTLTASLYLGTQWVGIADKHVVAMAHLTYMLALSHS